MLGVYDATRMGALRFSISKDGPFLSDDQGLATPPWTTLRKLESASYAFEKNDGADASDGSDYLEIASFIRKYGGATKGDLRELWRRIVFSMAVSNTDDHLRNHGFILDREGWVLSPLYDVNPNIYGDTLSLNVDSDSNLIDFNLALSVANLYDLTDKQAMEELGEIRDIVDTNWRKLAKQYGLSRSEIEGMSPAFNMAYKE